ncbi:hypothetical protein DFQ04_3510 [Algoriphagus boseongensis]|uniref:Uncharacterized protein n=1 Tax=Algoriphagus boseongensis TaxID=1442587 RepID=A0A4R6T4M4_9BACT|nr:hypothetical protein [Algoriphagus boseongensis]TDQ13786.1 hypothetical protein DFQ04_3510 [Algoriphagus boseongensis]
MPSKIHSFKNAHPLRKKIVGIILRLILVLLFLEFVLYFGSNIFLSKYAQRKINEATKEVYEIDFNRINLSLLRRGVFMDGLVMKPVDSRIPDENQALFDFTLDQVGLSGFWFDFSEKEFTISKIYLDNPSVELKLPPNQEKAKKKVKSGKDISPIKQLELEIQKSISKLNLAGLRIEEVEIDHANVFFFNFLSKGNLKANDTKLFVREIDLTTKGVWKTPFNARGFEFELEEVSFPLPDGVHSILADRVFISSLDNLIDIQKFSLTSDRKVPSKSYYDVKLDKLLLGNVDLNRAFMTSELLIDELILNAPKFSVASNPQPKSDSTATGDLNDLIKGNLNSIAIKELSINNGQFTKSQISDTLKNRIEIDELNFKMIQFYLGEDSLRRQNQFFYGEDASMEIKGGRLYLGDNVHLLEGEKVSVSSFRNNLFVENLTISPRPGAAEKNSINNLIQVSLPEFTLDQLDLKKLYNEGIFSVRDVLVDRPDVEFTEYQKVKSESTKAPLSEIVAGFLSEAEIEKFEVREGVIQFKDESGRRSNDLGFDKFSILLEGLHIKPDTLLPLQDQFYTEEIYLSLDNYRLKIKDNLHLIFADNLKIDSRNQLLEVRNLKIQPQSEEQIQTLLDSYGKTAAINFSVPLFRAEGIDIKSVFFDQTLSIGKISLPKPDFQITNYRAKEKKSQVAAAAPTSTDDIRGLLLGYFNSISIDSVNLDQAKINYQSLGGEKKTSFQEDNFSLRLKNFSLDPGDTSLTGKTLFSEEIDLRFSNYSFSLANGKYLAEAGVLKYNSKDQTIFFENLTLQPGNDLGSRIAIGLDFPKVALIGVDIEEFVFQNILDLQKLEFDQGLVEIGIDRQILLKKEAGNRGPKKATKAIDWINIDTITAKNSFLQLNFLAENDAQRSVQTEFGFLIRDFHLDTLVLDKTDLRSVYSQASLDLKNFVFALPDSVHTISFNAVQLADSRQELVFSNLKITPKDHFGMVGSPVIEAQMDQLAIVNNHLPEVLKTKTFDMRKVKMVNPKVDIYLDTLKADRTDKPTKPKNPKSLVESIVLGDFQVVNGDFQIHRKGKDPDPRMDFNEVNLSVSDLQFDFLKKEQKVNLEELARKNISFSMNDYQIETPDSLYKVSFDQISYQDGGLKIEGLYYRPVKGNYAHLRSMPFQTDAVTARVKSLNISGLDPAAYFGENKLIADVVTLEGAELDLFRDKRYPADTTILKYMPQYLMTHAKIDADINAVQVRNSRVRYFEMAPKGNLPGMISFDSIQVDLAPFYLRRNKDEFPTDQVRLGIQAKIMNESNVQLQSLMYFTEKYPMDVTVSLDKFRFAEVNDFMEKTLFVKAIDGTVTGGQWDFRLNEDYAIGKMAFGYTDLKIQFVDSLTYERGLGKLKIYTFGANLIAKNNNPRAGGKKVVARRIYLERDKRKFIFSSWWKATFSGLRGTFGLGQPKIPDELRKEEED